MLLFLFLHVCGHYYQDDGATMIVVIVVVAAEWNEGKLRIGKVNVPAPLSVCWINACVRRYDAKHTVSSALKLHFQSWRLWKSGKIRPFLAYIRAFFGHSEKN